MLELWYRSFEAPLLSRIWSPAAAQTQATLSPLCLFVFPSVCLSVYIPVCMSLSRQSGPAKRNWYIHVGLIYDGFNYKAITVSKNEFVESHDPIIMYSDKKRDTTAQFYYSSFTCFFSRGLPHLERFWKVNRTRGPLHMLKYITIQYCSVCFTEIDLKCFSALIN